MARVSVIVLRWVPAQTGCCNHSRHRVDKGRHLHSSTTSDSPRFSLTYRVHFSKYYQFISLKIFLNERPIVNFSNEELCLQGISSRWNLSVTIIFSKTRPLYHFTFHLPLSCRVHWLHGAVHSTSVCILGSALGFWIFPFPFSLSSIKTTPYISHTEDLLLTDNSRERKLHFLVAKKKAYPL